MPENVPTVDQIRAYLLANGWQMGESGRAAYLMVGMGRIRMLHEPTEYDLGKAVFDISLAEDRHPADVRKDILACATTPVPDSPAAGDVVAALTARRIELGLSQRRVGFALGRVRIVLNELKRLTDRVAHLDSARDSAVRAWKQEHDGADELQRERDALAARVAELEAHPAQLVRADREADEADVRAVGSLLEADDEDVPRAREYLRARFADRIAALGDDADGGAE